MAVLEDSISSKTRENMKKPPKNQTKKVLAVAQELKLARVLAGNNKTARDRALKSLRKWFENRSNTFPFSEDDFLRLWKGLFYSMWMSDKPLIQEECAENIATLVHSLPLDASLLFYKCSMRILMNEWFGIDQLRLDKFLMFVRRLLRQILFVLKNHNWNKSTIVKFTTILSETILQPNEQKPTGLLLHFIEIYLEELAKTSDNGLSPQLAPQLIEPFIKELAFSRDDRVLSHIRRFIFIYLIRQSDLGLEYDEKYKAWRDLGFPGSINSMKKIPIEAENQIIEETGIQNFDPRAGRVDVELPQIRFNSKLIVQSLTDVKFTKNTSSKSRKILTDMIENFKKLASGIYPLGVQKVIKDTGDNDMSLRKAVNRLVKFDKKIKGKKAEKRKRENEIVLKNGKKIKLDDSFVDKIQKDFRKKHKLEVVCDVPKKKLKQMEVESIFHRNSGTWFVTKTNDDDEKQKEKTPEKILFENEWATSDVNFKRRLSLPEELLRDPFSNSTPAKRVKINTKLNKSQDMQQHRAQILSSPAIPYDANRKPLKPLLKSTPVKSPINPFY